MSIETKEIKRVFRYNGIALPDMPGMEPREIRDLYSAQYPELVSAEIEDGGIKDGEHEFTFRKAVGTKGTDGRLAALKASINAEAKGQLADSNSKFVRALGRGAAKKVALPWGVFVNSNYPAGVADNPVVRAMPDSEALAPVV